jgi:predicted metalloprotease with PDZ domain
VTSAERVFGRLPYRDYTFIFIDGTGGGLEHLNSTTIGVSSADVARDPLAGISTTAHEFFHLWNIKRIRPAVLGPFDYAHVVRTTDLWWSEGVTDYFAEEILRRSGLTSDSATLRSFADNLAAYFGNPAHARLSAERSSWTAWDPPSANGGYAISYYLQGAILGELLELQIRAATGNRRGMDDLARTMFDRYAGERGFAGEDLLHAANEICGCDLQPFFGAHVSGATELDVDRYLALAGLRAVVTRTPALTNGAAAPDLRLGVLSFAGIGSAGGPAGFAPRLSITDPTSTWARAGLRSGDLLLSINGRPIASSVEVAPALAGVRIGEVVTLVVEREGARRTVRATVAGYETTKVRIEPLAAATAAQLAVRRAWLGAGRSTDR